MDKYTLYTAYTAVISYGAPDYLHDLVDEIDWLRWRLGIPSIFG